MQLLKEQTRAEHEAVEAVSYSTNIMDGTLNLKQYEVIVKANYLFNSFIEYTIYPLLKDNNLDSRFELATRAKTNLLLADLALLGIEAVELEPVTATVNTIEAALGYLYVAEGSTLGGAVIARALAKNPNLTSVTNYNFYGCYGENTGNMWKNFIVSTEATAGMLNNSNAIVEGAKNAFTLFGTCLEKAKTHSNIEV